MSLGLGPACAGTGGCGRHRSGGRRQNERRDAAIIFLRSDRTHLSPFLVFFLVLVKELKSFSVRHVNVKDGVVEVRGA